MTDLHRNAVVAEKIPACDRPLIIQGPDAGVYVPGLEGPAGMPLVPEALLRRGLPEATIRKVLGENLIRVLSKGVTPCKPGSTTTSPA